jgi:hypothetical protein
MEVRKVLSRGGTFTEKKWIHTFLEQVKSDTISILFREMCFAFVEKRFQRHLQEHSYLVGSVAK